MSFLSPWVLCGLAAIAAPIIIHLLNKFRVRTTDWGAMRFLLDTVRKDRRRVSMDDLILLILRCLLVALAVLAFARPVLKGLGLGGGGPVAAVVVLDNSASMAQTVSSASRFDLAKTAIRAWLDQQDTQSTVALYLAATRTTPLIGKPANDFALFRKSLDESAVSDFGSDFTQSLRLAVESLQTVTGRPKEIRIYSDGQATAFLHREELGLLAREHPDIVIRPLTIGEGAADNLGLVTLSQDGGVTATGQAVRFHAEVMNSGTASANNIKVDFIMDERLPAGAATISAIAPGETQSVNVMVTFPSAGPHRITATLPVDAFATDNQRTAAVDVTSRLDVVIAEADLTGSQGGFFISRALVPVPHEQTANYFLAPRVVRNAGLSKALAQGGTDRPEVTFLCDPARLTADIADALESYVKSGGNLVVFPGSGSGLGGKDTPDALVRLLPGTLAAPVEITASAPPQSWQADGFTHAITRFWNDSANGGLGLVKFTRYCPLTLRTTGSPNIITAFTDGQPAVAEWSYGRGTVVLFGSNLTREWTNFPLHPSFVPFLQRLVGFCHDKHATKLNYQPGEPFRMSVDESLAGQDFTIRRPGAQTARTAGQVVAGETGTHLRYAATEHLGAYQLSVGDEPIASFAVQLDPAESDLRPVDPAVLMELSDVPRVASGHDARMVVLKDYWPALIWCVVALFVAEAAMAHRMSHLR
ncbi:MAG: BatA domain-containing protein [Verrucomicrobia bacterium]|nr:BatA domain-containing protein [Verrucomicrobiota bacterium]